jgi:hypothetical protein
MFACVLSVSTVKAEARQASYTVTIIAHTKKHSLRHVIIIVIVIVIVIASVTSV